MNRHIKRALKYFLNHGLRSVIGDKAFLKARYRLEMGKKLDLSHPVTMNEKLQWLKLNNRYDEMTLMVDKIKVKDLVAARIGKEYIIPTLAVWDRPEDISLKDLPDRFVIKTNHSGGNTGVIVCSDKRRADLDAIRARMARSLKSDDIYKSYGEWPYKNVERKIFAEMNLGESPVDYKFYCFNGKADSVMLCTERSTGHPKFYFFDKDWNLRRYNKRGKEAPEGFTLPKPEGMDKMFEIAAKLSEGIPFVRVDLYNVDGKIYFGELTFFPASGFDANRLPETDIYFGNMIDLSLAVNEE